MAQVLVNDASLTAIAGAIREKLDVETTYLPSQMAGAIGSIPTGSSLTSADEGKVVIEDSGSYVLAAQSSRNISQNGTYDTTTNDEVVVEVSGGGVVEKFNATDEYLLNSTSYDNTASTTKSAGVVVSFKNDVLISKVKVFTQSSGVNVYVASETDGVIGSVTNVSTEQNQWNEIEFDSPIRVTAQVKHYFWFYNVGSEGLNFSRTRPSSLLSSEVEDIVNTNSIATITASSKTNNVPSGTESNTYSLNVLVDGYYTQKIADLTQKTITQNGTYNASDDSADGYSSVTVNVSGVETMQESAWEALTTAQKQGHGLVAIVESSSGYVRGTLVNGADYTG